MFSFVTHSPCCMWQMGTYKYNFIHTFHLISIVPFRDCSSISRLYIWPSWTPPPLMMLHDVLHYPTPPPSSQIDGLLYNFIQNKDSLKAQFWWAALLWTEEFWGHLPKSNWKVLIIKVVPSYSAHKLLFLFISLFSKISEDRWK